MDAMSILKRGELINRYVMKVKYQKQKHFSSLISVHGNCDKDGLWTCPNTKQCIAMKHVCDGVVHCVDGADENRTLCLAWDCQQHDNVYQCVDNDYQCIPAEKICDGTTDCLNGTDPCFIECNYEDQCTCVYSNIQIKRNQICNGEDDCLLNDMIDRSDEMDCINKECAPNMTKCDDMKQCIKHWHICDGQVDCMSGSDELCQSDCIKRLNIPTDLWKSITLTQCPGFFSIFYIIKNTQT